MGTPRILVDGIDYIPATAVRGPRVAVAMSTHNRNQLVAETLQSWRDRTPASVPIFLIDDASEKPVDGADYRFEHRAGIPAVKNKGIELCMASGADFIALIDDDTYCLSDDWVDAYTSSPEPHLAYGFAKIKNVTGRLGDVQIIHQDEQHTAYSGQRGCFLWYRRIAIDTCGGMDPIYGNGMYEHSDLANRIHHAGLTTWRYADLTGSNKLIRSLDEEAAVERTVPLPEREAQVNANVKIHHHRRDTWFRSYVDYRQPTDDVIITTLFTGGSTTKPARDRASYKPDVKLLQPLAESVKHGRMVVLHDQLQDPMLVTGNHQPVEFIQLSPPKINFFLYRWQVIWTWLRDHPGVRWIWAVDGTDVTINPHRDPFDGMQPDTLYSGWESKVCADPWMIDRHKNPTTADFLRTHGTLQLLNAGVGGGDRETMLGFTHRLFTAYYDAEAAGGWKDQGDMGVWNQIAYTEYADRLHTGPDVTSTFKAYETPKLNTWSRFFHK